MRICKVDGCARQHAALGYCRPHWHRWRKWGNPLDLHRPPPMVMFWDRVMFTDDCWVWQGSTSKLGYGRFESRRMTGSSAAHRISYEFCIGPIPDGLELDHLCRNPPCVRPEHLEPVTHQENVLRGNAPSAIAHRTNVCQRGHDMINNTHRVSANKRACATCRLSEPSRLSAQRTGLEDPAAQEAVGRAERGYEP